MRSYFRDHAPPGAQRVRFPPALTAYEYDPSSLFWLRDADAFEIYVAGTHPAHRPGIAVPSVPLDRLPHFFGWHTPFRVTTSGWVYRWHPSDTDEAAVERHWLNRGDVWSPQSCQFQRPRTLPGNGRWVPTAWIDDERCYLVPRSESGRANVLFVDASGSQGPACRSLPTRQGEADIPHGWQLRPDLQVRSPTVHLPGGDVLVPAHGNTRRRAHTMLRAVSQIATGIGLLRSRVHLFLCVLCILPTWGAYGMIEAPGPDGISVITYECHTVPVGKYAWRVPDSLRLCDAAVRPGLQARLISPFRGLTDLIDVAPDTSLEELRLSLTSSEPAWAHHITPVWPTPSDQILTFLPALCDPRLAVLLVVSDEWQAAFILPRRADLRWILDTLRHGTEGPLYGLRAPPAACSPIFSEHEAVDWRDGDVILALPYGDTHHGLHTPSFASTADVRHSAHWAIDYEVTAHLHLIMWRPGWWPTQTTACTMECCDADFRWHL